AEQNRDVIIKRISLHIVAVDLPKQRTRATAKPSKKSINQADGTCCNKLQLAAIAMSSSASLVSQSVLMAFTVTVNKFASSNVHAVPRAQPSSSSPSSSPSAAAVVGRRSVIFSAIVGAYPAAAESKTELLNKYLKKSEDNKAKNDKEQLKTFSLGLLLSISCATWWVARCQSLVLNFESQLDQDSSTLLTSYHGYLNVIVS
ncbi:hypothetical protein LINPERHAP2_LOCUS27380, partial [Linum perenne]